MDTYTDTQHPTPSTRDARRAATRALLIKPGPHRPTWRTWAGVGLSVVVLLALWLISLATCSNEPAAIRPADIPSGEGVQATLQATTFTQSTSILTVKVKLQGTGDLVDGRGLLQRNLDIRVVDDEGVRLIQLESGDPLGAEEIALQMDGDVDKYPFDEYNGDFSLLAERVEDDGTLTPIPLSVGTAKAETGWYTKYEIDKEVGAESKITIVAMQREAFVRSFATMLAVLMLLIALMAVAVSILCFTNRRASDAGIVGWIVALLFALPFVRRTLPGDPPIGCLLDVAVFSWAILLCVIAMVLTMVAWMRQSHAAMHAEAAQAPQR